MAEHFAFSKVRAATRADWPVVPLGAVITRSEYGTSDPASAEGTIPIIGMKEVVDGNVVLDPSARIEGDAETLAPLMVRRGDILLNRTNSPDLVGKTGICRGDADAVFASYLVRLHVDAKKADAEYVNYWLNDAETQKLIKRVSTRAVSQANVNPTELKRHCPIPLPPLPEQRRIAGILRTWDEAIDAASRLIDAKRRRLDVLRANLMTPAHRGEGWRMAPLGELTAEGKGRNKGGALGREQVMGVSNARGVVPMRDATIASDLTRYKLLPPRGFAYNPMRINVGSIAMSALDAPVLVSPDYVVFTCRPKALAPGYLDHFRRTRFWNHYVNAMGSGSVRVRIYYRDLADIEIPVPGLAEQKRILGVLDLAAQDLAASRTHLDALKRQKRGLMQKLLTGEWRVPAEPAV